MAGNYTDIRSLVARQDDGLSTHVPSSTTSTPGIERKEGSVINREDLQKRVLEVEKNPEQEVHQPITKTTIKLPSPIQASQPTPQQSQPLPARGMPQLEVPLSDEVLYKGLHAPITSSFRWLSEFYLRFFKGAHLTLKKIHGKIMRVVSK